MSDVGEVDSLLAKAIKEQRNRLETFGIISAIMLIIVASWYIWPGIDGNADFLPRFGPGIILVVLALAIQDFIDYGPKHRSRIGIISAISWPPLLMIGMNAFSTNEEMMVRIGYGLMIGIGYTSYSTMSKLLTGTIQAVRFRGIIQFVGSTSATALLISNPPEGIVMYTSIGICIIAFIISIYDTVGKDPDKAARRKFKVARESLELKILELRAQGVQVDQAASLLQNATEVGYADPKEGTILLNLALDDIERTVAMSSDISDIRDDVYSAVQRADDIAPTAKRAQKILSQGDREMELGSLREAEMLFRKAKTHANEIIEYWGKAEEAIAEAKRALSGCEGTQYEPLKRAVRDAEEALLREAPAEAMGLVIAVPEHVENLGSAGEIAADTIDEAKRVVEAAAGIDDADFSNRIEKSQSAFDSGDFSLARGLADSVIREVTREAEAMVEVQKAWRQRKKLTARWSEYSNSEDGDEKLLAVNKARKAKQWSHAAMLLEQITNELDSEIAANSEAGELLAFLQEEWRDLRNKLDTSGIKFNDSERSSCEAAIGQAVEAHKKGDNDACLTNLGVADGLMEKLRRRA